MDQELVTAFRKAIGGTNNLKSDMLGIVEQLICVYGGIELIV